MRVATVLAALLLSAPALAQRARPQPARPRYPLGDCKPCEVGFDEWGRRVAPMAHFEVQHEYGLKCYVCVHSSADCPSGSRWYPKRCPYAEKEWTYPMRGRDGIWRNGFTEEQLRRGGS